MLPRLLVVLALATLSCASGAARLEGSTVRTNGLAYEVGPVPASWRSVSVEGNDLAWFDAENASLVHVDHTCERTQDTPLAALVQHLLIGFTQREFSLQETVPFDAREARHVLLRARLDGVPRAIELYVMKKDGCVFDLGLVAPPERFERARGAFDAFVRGFRTARTPMVTP